jgi:SAM-dependent methyltransferase
LPRILDVGCGPSKYPGAIGMDMNPKTAADVLCDLDRGRLPFRDSSFDEIRAVHLIEHVENAIATIEEFHRVARAGATIFIVTPHYTDVASYTDPTHRRHLSTESFHYFYPGGKHGPKNGQESWYTDARLKERRLRIKLLRVWRILGLELLVNRARWFRRFWEYYLSFVIRGKVMEFTFEVVK